MRRPLPIALVAIALAIATGIAAVVGTAILFPGTVLDRMWEYNRPAQATFQAMGRSLGGAFIGLSLLAGITARGLLRGCCWAWWLALGIFAVNGLGDVIALIKTRDLIRSGSGILFAVAFLVLLARRSTRAYLE